MIDIHSHILPGIDDGSESLVDSIAIVKELARQGITDIIATPHYMTDSPYVSPRTKNLKLLDSLQKELQDADLGVNIYLGNEIYINEEIDNLVKRNKVSPMADSKYLLVELPMSGEYPNYEDVLLDLLNSGYKVILAHPERYSSFQDNYELVEILFRDGVLLQCNLGSLVGHYGKKAKKCLVHLLKERMVFAFGSDIHRCHDGNDYLKAQKKLKKYLDEDEIRELLVSNPKKILGRGRGLIA